jgi:hypothetical protein
MREIRPEALTLSTLIELGPDDVDFEQLPPGLLVALARKYVQAEARKRLRQKASKAERRAYGMTGDRIDARAQQAAVEAAAKAKVVWADILDVRITSPGSENQTWGNATTEDHLFAAQARELEGATHIRIAAMHRRAVADIDAAGARNLNETTMGLK